MVPRAAVARPNWMPVANDAAASIYGRGSLGGAGGGARLGLAGASAPAWSPLRARDPPTSTPWEKRDYLDRAASSFLVRMTRRPRMSRQHFRATKYCGSMEGIEVARQSRWATPTTRRPSVTPKRTYVEKTQGLIERVRVWPIGAHRLRCCRCRVHAAMPGTGEGGNLLG